MMVEEQSPCRSCPRREEDKNEKQCVECPDRIAYINGRISTQNEVLDEFSGKQEEKEMTAMTDNNDLKDRRPWTLWTDEEIQFLRDNVDKMTNKQLAGKLGRSVGSVPLMLSKHHITRKNQRKRTKGLVKGIINNQILLDFSDKPELYEFLKKLAEKEYRTVSNQVFYLIAREVKNHDE